MKIFFVLMKQSFVALLLNISNSRGSSRNKKSRGGGAMLIPLALMVGLPAYLAYIYAAIYAQMFGTIGATDYTISMMALLGIMFALIFSISSAQSHIFSTKDMDFTMPLPVSPFTIMMSRLLALYAEMLLFNVVFLVSTGVSLLAYGGSAFTIIRLFVGSIFITFVPTLLGVLMGFLITLLTSRMKNKSLFLTVFNVLIFAAVFIFIFLFSQNSNQQQDIRPIINTIETFLPHIAWLRDFAINGSILSLVFLLLGSLFPFLLVSWLFSFFYKNLLSTLISGGSVKKNYRLRKKDISYKSSFSALLSKEFKRFVSTPIYFMNSGVGMIIIIFLSIASVFLKSKITTFIHELASFGMDINNILPLSFLLFMTFFAVLSLPSNSSISLEGKSFWILKSSPVGTRTIFAAKAGLSFFLVGASIMFSGILFSYSLGISPLSAILVLVIGLLSSLFFSTTSLYINLLLPRLDAVNDTVTVKQSASVIVSMLSTWAFLGIFTGLFFLVGSNFLVLSLCIIALLVPMNIGMLFLLDKSGTKLFNQIQTP